MRRLLLLVTVVWSCAAYCPDTDTNGYKNTQWQPNNVLIKLINYIYDSLALTTSDMCSPEKRFMSVYTYAISYLLTSNDTNFERAVEDGRRRAEKRSNDTAAAIAGTFRGLNDAVLVVIDQPMNDVLASCTPDTYEDECRANLNDFRKRNEDHCKGYHNNVAVYNRLVKWANRQDTIDYIEDLTHMSTQLHGDTATLDYFQKKSTVKFKACIKELQAITLQVKHGSFHCNALSFINLHCL